MKKKLKSSLAIFSVATMCFSVSSYVTSSKHSSDLLCENVDVLAQTEDFSDRKMTLTPTKCTTYAQIEGVATRVSGKVTQCVEIKYNSVCTAGTCYYGSAESTK